MPPETDSTTSTTEPDSQEQKPDEGASQEQKPDEKPDDSAGSPPKPEEKPDGDKPAGTEGDSEESDLTDQADDSETVKKFKRIARQQEKEKGTARTERDEAVTRAEAAETALQEAQAAAAEVPDLKAKVDEQSLEILRYQVGDRKGLTLKQAKRLKGSTKEELEKDADEFIAEGAMPTRTTPSQPGSGQSSVVDLDKLRKNRY